MALGVSTAGMGYNLIKARIYIWSFWSWAKMKFYNTNLNFAKSLMQMLRVIEHIVAIYCLTDWVPGRY